MSMDIIHVKIGMGRRITNTYIMNKLRFTTLPSALLLSLSIYIYIYVYICICIYIYTHVYNYSYV